MAVVDHSGLSITGASFILVLSLKSTMANEILNLVRYTGLIKLKGHMTLYADDTTLSFSFKDITQLFLTIEEDLALISDWLKHNRLLLNLAKTNAVLFSNGTHLTKQTVLPDLIQ